MQKNNRHGFTLIELIIVIAIIALLAAATFVAVDPAKRIGDANNAQRWADVTAIADAWQKYTVDFSGTNVTTTAEGSYAIKEFGVTGDASVTCAATTTPKEINLEGLVSNGYIGSIPTDPLDAAGAATGYYLEILPSGALEVGACTTYDTAVIRVIR